MATVSTPTIVWTAALQGSLTGIQYSASLYFSVNLTAGFEIQIPVQVRFSLVSSDPIVNVYRSMDGGVTYDVNPFYATSISRLASRIVQQSIALPTGQYLLQIQHAGSNSASVAVLTAAVITSIVNV
jgi:hypothetical protein